MQFWQTNEFWNSIIGVLVGGGITWLIQKLDQNHNRKAQRSETHEKNKSTAKLLLNKLMRLNSNISHIGNHVEAEYAKVPESAHHGPYSFVLPLVALPEPIRFSDSETELVYSLGNADFLTSI